MKKLIVTLTALAVLTMSLLAVSASGVEENSTNMDAKTYTENHLERLDQALENGEIEQSDYELLVTRINENALDGTFGNGPNGYLDEDKDCVLGQEGSLGIFRNDNSGMRNGHGNGIRNQVADGSGNGSKGLNKGQGN